MQCGFAWTGEPEHEHTAISPLLHPIPDQLPSEHGTAHVLLPGSPPPSNGGNHGGLLEADDRDAGRISVSAPISARRRTFRLMLMPRSFRNQR
jgi:hypothetical protein